MNPYVLRRVSGNPKCPRNDSDCSSNASLKEAQREGSVMRSESGGRCKFSASLLKQGHFPQVSTRTQDRNRVFNDLSYAQRDTVICYYGRHDLNPHRSCADPFTPSFQLFCRCLLDISANFLDSLFTTRLQQQCQYFLYTAIMSNLKWQCSIMFKS